ncbi:hypothetical protein MGSAQ_002584, partial [marine sediment metagenome]
QVPSNLEILFEGDIVTCYITDGLCTL